MEALLDAGATVVANPADMGPTLKQVLRG
jgi:hypothetical protein